MPFARLREAFFTLRFRLVLWITLVVFVLVCLTMTAIGQIVSRSLEDEFDTLLRRDLVELRQIFKEHGGTSVLFERIGRWVQEDDEVSFTQIYGGDGGMLWQSKGSPRLPRVAPPAEPIVYFDYGGYRYLETRDASTGWLLRVGLSRATLDADIRLVNRLLILASVVILILTPLAGFFLAGRATRPLKWIIATTARLQPQHLQERLPVRRSGDELDQLSTTINGMLDRIASYLEQNRDFIASAAHELRSPLAAIRSSVEVALNRPRSNEEYAELLSDVMEECTRLGTLVDRLLLLAEGDAGQISGAHCRTRLDKIVAESVDMFQGVAEAKEVGLRAQGLAPITVPGDEYHIRQIVRNLIDNALKFTTTPGEVRVELETKGERAVLRVIDQGVGIHRDDVPRVFERFYRSDRSRRRHDGAGGIGLGLSICQSLVHALKGSIRAESELGKGSTFTVELPRLDD